MAKFREAAALALICFHSFAQKTPCSPDAESELRVTVNVYNGINLPTDELSRAEREAERIFSYASIHLIWTIGPLASDVNSDTTSETGNPPTLQLRIWPRSVAGNRPSSPDTLGFCLSFKNSDAVVLADAVQKHVVYGGPSFADLLGLAMAHELGHLLLQSARHSAAGIMRARLTEKGLRDDDRGYLRFTADEAEFIRTEVRRRMGVGSASKKLGPSMEASTLRLTLVIYDHAHVAQETLSGAESRVAEIFEHANVQLNWRDGFAYTAERHQALNPPPEDPATLVVKLQPESEAARYGVKSVCGGIGFPSGAIVFVRSFDSTRLGYIMAHELGHILLGPNAHAIVGIMRGTLLPEDWEKAAQGTLGFTHSQNEQIRMWIEQRSRR